MRRLGSIRRLDSLATEGVERSEPHGPPTAFRIWDSGVNVTDHGPTIFSSRSAEKLLREQSTRGNRYSIDVDHLSLDKDAPIENHAAVGWHSLEVRNGELWAVNVEWTEAVRAGLSKDPPAWKYFSPAYDIDPKTDEVVSYLNTALTNNPATHHVTALASREAKANMSTKAKKATWADLKAAIDGDDENAKANAYATIAAAFPDGDEKKEGEDEPEKKDSEEEPEKKDAKKCAKGSPGIVASLDSELAKATARIAALEKKDEDAERETLLATHEMTPALAKMLQGESIAYVRKTCAALPKKVPALPSKSTEHVQATRAGRADDRTARLSPEEKAKLDEQMGIKTRQDSVHWQGNARVFPAGATVKKETK